MCHVGQTLPLKNMNTIEKPSTCSTSEELLPPQERWFRAQGHCSEGGEKNKEKNQPSCKQKKLRKRLGWQGTDPELLHYRLGRNEQENLQAFSQVLKASKADGRKHWGSSYNSLTGLPKWHYLPRVWQQALRMLQFSPFTRALLWSNFWLFLGCLGKSARKRTASALTCLQRGSTRVPFQKMREQRPFETGDFASTAALSRAWMWSTAETPLQFGKPCASLVWRSDPHLLKELFLLEQHKGSSWKHNQAQGVKWQQQFCYTFLSSRVFQILLTILLFLLHP